MSEPSAMEKARTLVRFAKMTGTPLKYYSVTITDDEGMVLMDWFMDQADPRMVDCDALRQAIVEAKDHKDPFEVLQHFSLLGMSIERWTSLQ